MMKKMAFFFALALATGDAFAARTLYNGFTGTWWDPARSGEGVFIHEMQDDTLVVAWFTYDPARPGEQLYLVGAGHVTDDAVTADVTSTSGGIFGPNFDPALVQRPLWGSLTLALSGCDSLSLSYVPVVGPSGSVHLTRILPMTTPICEPYVPIIGQRYDGPRTFRITGNPSDPNNTNTPPGCLDVLFPDHGNASMVLSQSGGRLIIDYDEFFDKQCRFQGEFSRRDNAVLAGGTYLCSNGFVEGTWSAPNIRLGSKYVEIDIDLTNMANTCSQALRFRAVVPPL